MKMKKAKRNMAIGYVIVMIPLLVLPLLMQVLSLLFCLIQAVVFTMLLSIYIEEAIEE